MENEALNEAIINGFYCSLSATVTTSSWNNKSHPASKPTSLYAVVCFLSFYCFISLIITFLTTHVSVTVTPTKLHRLKFKYPNPIMPILILLAIYCALHMP